jgi:hypothetical protein
MKAKLPASTISVIYLYSSSREMYLFLIENKANVERETVRIESTVLPYNGTQMRSKGEDSKAC